MNTFQAYPRIAESPRSWNLDPAAARALSRVPWIATEKIHGANFCIACDGAQLRFAKRKAWLEPNDRFFDHHRATARLEEPLFELHDMLCQAGVALEIRVYGELFGGHYPHPEVAPVPGLSPVQTGVAYSPNLEFVAFDLAIVDERGFRFLDFGEALQHFARARLFAVEPLFAGTWTEVQELDVCFDSTLPARLGLPPFPPGSNLAEGMVLKPARELGLEGPRGAFRPVLKRKISEFAEDARYHQAQRPPARHDASYLLDLIEWEAMSRLNPPRIQSAISKLGNPETAQQEDAVVHEIVADIFLELGETLPTQMASLPPDERALLEAVLADEALTLLTS